MPPKCKPKFANWWLFDKKDYKTKNPINKKDDIKMERTYIKDIVPGYHKVQGFVENFRNKRTMAFIVVKDITGKLQVTIEKEKHPEMLEMLDSLTIHSVVTFEGEVVASEYVKMGGKEMYPDKMRVESIADALPIKDDSDIDHKMDYRWIDLRRDANHLMLEMQTTLTNAMREFLVKRNFVEIHTPKLIAAASESGSDVFEVKYFDGKAYLAQSPQFYKQMAMAAGLERIFETGPVFRAEKSYTNKHATEFTGFDLEFSYIESFDDVMKMEEELLAYALEKVAEKHGEEIKERNTAVRAFLHQSSFAETAAGSSAPRYGILIVPSTDVSFGNVTTNSRVNTNVPHRIFQKML